MSNPITTEELLDFAIGEEESAATFYAELAEKMDKPWMKKTLNGFAQEERGHKAKLLKMKEGGLISGSSENNVTDLKLSDYLVDIVPSLDMDYQEILIVAMKKEKSAFKLYSDLARQVQSEELREGFLALAQEEAKHKLRFEVEYDEMILTEN